MKNLFILTIVLFLSSTLSAQYVYTIKADSVKITNNCDTAELILENHTQNVLGFLYNKGKGRTEFRRATKLNDSTLIFGDDTLVFKNFSFANNGLSKNGDTIQFGQLPGASGNPANLLNNREVPFNGKTIGFTGTGGIGIGITNPASIAKIHLSDDGQAIASSLLQGGGDLIVSSNASNLSVASIVAASSANAAPFLTGIKSRGTLSAPEVPLENDYVFRLRGSAFDGNGIHSTAEISTAIDGTVGDEVVPQRIVFRTSQTQGQTLTERMRINSRGNVIINSTTDNGNKFQVSGTGYFGDTLKLNTVRTGDAADSALVWHSATKAVRKVVQTGISNLLNRVTVSDANYTATSADYLIAYVSLTTGRTVNLPAANTMTNRTLIIKDESGSAGTNNITIDGLGSETIDGSLTKVINSNFGSVTFYSNGSVWFFINQ
jgi:hypothetical protein